MDNLFGIYIFTHTISVGDKEISYVVSGDTRDFIAQRADDIDIDEKSYPKWFDYGKVNNRITPCFIENTKLYNEILEKLKLELVRLNMEWQSH
ncbi:MAG: hypothetical protein IPN29_00600 [Saprospiraceae bacterium]|nr:hypothetical protein [Saprospiraceae bacterium]